MCHRALLTNSMTLIYRSEHTDSQAAIHAHAMRLAFDPPHLNSARYTLYPAAMLERPRLPGSVFGLRPTPQ